tara:strand:+ start:406 stop:570 length:165 start_codon:yes stop_codon:yes gene_type:complete
MENEMTTKVDPFNSFHFGHETFSISNLTSEKKSFILFISSHLAKLTLESNLLQE